MIYLSIGSNLKSKYGNRFDNILKSIQSIKKYNVKILNISSFYESPSYPNKTFPKFLNVCLKLKSSYNEHEFLKIIKKIEKHIGRTKSPKNYPRVCDIDIIDYNKIVTSVNKLKLPHPRLHLRNFVLFPLKEIEPQWFHPVFRQKLDFYLSQLNIISRVEITRLNKNVIIK